MSLETTPIQTECDTLPLRVFVRLIYSDSTKLYDSLSPRDWMCLLDLCDHFMADGSEKLVIDAIDHHYDLDDCNPWDIFVLACQRGRIELARSAIRASTSGTCL
jgi:hypothetical protein